mmetsp:Transcript_22533/g.29253  ORF Transcript_22533/g.29253 Transcript_22533/m.29253 type:complete len:355 (+) Transcript_22533:3-1067(+)
MIEKDFPLEFPDIVDAVNINQSMWRLPPSSPANAKLYKNSVEKKIKISSKEHCSNNKTTCISTSLDSRAFFAPSLIDLKRIFGLCAPRTRTTHSNSMKQSDNQHESTIMFDAKTGVLTPSFSRLRTHSSVSDCRSRLVSEYGWDLLDGFDEDFNVSLPNSQLQIQQNLFSYINDSGFASYNVVESEANGLNKQKKILFHLDQTRAAVGCKGFVTSSSDETIWCACTIAGVRIVQTDVGEHVEFKTIIAIREIIWVGWKRYSEYESISKSAKELRFPRATSAWADVKTAKKIGRCFSIPYLLEKGGLLQDFLQCFLFDSELDLFINSVMGVGLDADKVKNLKKIIYTPRKNFFTH